MRKALSLLLCLAMCLSIFPVGAIAEEAESQTVPEAEAVFSEQPEMIPESEADGEALPTQEEVIIFEEPAEMIPMSEPENYEGIVEILTIPEPEGFEEPETEEISAAETEAVSKCGDDLVWTLDDNGTLTVTGTGEMFNFADADEAPWYSYSSSIKAAVIKSGVTSIGELAFTSCENLTKIEIADSVVSIGEGAFSECRALSEVIYSGTEADWGNIFIESDNEPLVGSKFIFISEEGIPEEAISEEAIPEEAEELSAADDPAQVKPVVVLSSNPDGSVKLTWQAIEGAVKYEVSAYFSSAGAYVVRGMPEEPEFTDVDAPVDETCSYRVRAVYANGATSYYSDNVLNKRQFVTPVLSLKEINAEGAPVLSWKSVGGAVKYELYAYTTTAGDKLLAELDGTVTEYTDENAPVNKACNYKIRAVASNGKYSSFSANVYNKRTIDKPVLSLKEINAEGAPVLSWEHIGGAVKYELYAYTTAAGEYKLLAELEGTATEYTDENAPVDEACNYKICAVAANGEYSYYSSNVYNKRTIDKPVLSLKEINAEGAPVLSWEHIGGAVRYELYAYTTAAGEYRLLAEPDSTATEYTDENAPVDEACNYKIRAVAANGKYSYYSANVYNKRTIKTPVLSLRENEESAPVLSWEHIGGAVRYELYAYTTAAGEYKLLAELDGAVTEYTDEDAQVNVACNYKIRAVAANGKYSYYSANAYNKRTIKTPVLTLSVNEENAPVLSWEHIGGAVKCEVWRHTADTGYVLETELDGTATEYIDENAPVNVACNYKICAVAANGVYSNYSNTVYNKRKIDAPVLSLEVNEEGAPILSWKSVGGADKYELWIHTATAGEYKLLVELEASETEYTDEDAPVNVACYYKVRAVSENEVYSNYSNSIYNKRTAAAPALSLTQHPQDLEIKEGETAHFSVEATGENLTYLWQQLAPSGEWADMDCTDAALSFTVTPELDGYQYRCIVSSGKDSITSDAATLTVIRPTVVSGITFEQTENGMKVVGFTSIGSNVVIPETVNDITVTEVGAEAFKDCTTLVSIDLPDTIEVIGERAFAGCTNLSSMN